MASNLEELRGKTSKAEEEESKLKQLIDQLTKDIVKEEVGPKYMQRCVNIFIQN